jgi:hypothetical protein
VVFLSLSINLWESLYACLLWEAATFMIFINFRKVLQRNLPYKFGFSIQSFLPPYFTFSLFLSFFTFIWEGFSQGAKKYTKAFLPGGILIATDIIQFAK